MPRKKALEKRIQRLEERKAKIKEKVQKSTDADEVRSLTEELETIIEDLNDLRDELEALENEEDNPDEGNGDDPGTNEDNPDEGRSNPIIVNPNVLGKFTNLKTSTQRSEDVFSTLEYRKAFMAYAQRGIAIPSEYQKRDSAANTTTLGATIPTTVLNEFINEVKVRYGQLFNKVRRLNVPGSLRIPIAKLQAEFRWISESTVSPNEDAGDYSEYVEFTFNTAELRVSQTLVSSIVSLDLFEREIVNVMMIAYLKAMDYGIVNGTGNGQMLGILNDPRVLNSGQVVEFTENEINDWTKWRKQFFAKLPLGYRAGEFIFPMSTVEAYLETMADNNNNPVFRQATGLEVNDGDALNPNGRFFGRDISLVEPDIIKDFDTAENGDVIGIFWNPQESYAINTNMEFVMRRYFDEYRNEWINKILTIVDGKVLNPKSIWLIKKKVTG